MRRNRSIQHFIALVLVGGGVWHRRMWTIFFPVVVSIFLAIRGFYETKNFERSELNSRFVDQAIRLVGRFQDELEILDRLPSVLDSDQKNGDPRPDELEFQRLSHFSSAIMPKIYAFSWADLVSDSDRAAYQRERGREMGMPSYKIWEFDPDGKPRSPSRRDPHLVIRRTDLLDSTQVYAGFDLASQFDQQRVVEFKNSEKHPWAISGASLLGDKSTQADLLVLNPRLDSHRQLVGFFAVAIHLGSMINAAISHSFEGPDDFAVSIYAQDSVDAPVFARGQAPNPQVNNSNLRYEATVGLKTIRNAKWSIRILPTEAYLARNKSHQSWVVLVGGLFFCFLLGILLMILNARGEALRGLAAKLESELGEKENAFENIRRLELELSRMWRLNTMGEMAAGLAHELSQPIASIRNYAQSILRRFGKQNVAEPVLLDSIEEISKEAERASSVIQSLRSFFKKGELRKTVENLDSVLEEISNLAESELRRQSTSLVISVKDPGCRVLVDRTQIGQVLLNLLRNAIESMSGNERDDRQVTVFTERVDKDSIRVSVSDEGSGVSQDNRERLFEPFFTTKPSGMGMGLAICKTIAEAHDGELWYASREKRGMSFYLKLKIISKEGPA